jgi:hypothetical protein
MDVTFESLVGPHILTGVDFEVVREQYYEDASVIRFVLDGVTYVCTEDPSDGYRSSMGSLIRDDAPTTPVKNTFVGVAVLGRLCTTPDNDILEFVDSVNGNVILEVGTSNTDDYYPCFVGNFYPELMHVNQGK